MYLSTVLILVLLFVFFYIFLSYNQFMNVISTLGFTQVEVEKLAILGDVSVVQLTGECSELVFYISPEQAVAIQRGMSQITGFRPMTHDLFVDVLEGFELNPSLVRITDMKDGTYFAEIVLQKWNRLLIVDSRPSDAIALAVRTNTPIYVNDNLLTRTC